MAKLIYNVLGNLVVKMDGSLERGLIELGMSTNSVDWFMLFVSGCMVLVIFALIAGLFILYGSVLRISFVRMIGLKSKRLRRNWSMIFTLSLMTIVFEILTII